MNAQDGGPAFPHQSDQYPEFNGMSLRDYFAGQALAGICAYSGEGQNLINVNPRALASTAYIWADAMLKAREGGAS